MMLNDTPTRMPLGTDNSPTLAANYPYTVKDVQYRPSFNAIDHLDLTHGTDFVYWGHHMRFRDAETATMYKLMQGI
jgi:hypothetical protein